MKNEFKPADFDAFVADADCMTRYQECAQKCLLFNFGGSVAPAIQDIISDVQGEEQTAAHSCDVCPLTPKEYRLAILLILDSLL